VQCPPALRWRCSHTLVITSVTIKKILPSTLASHPSNLPLSSSSSSPSSSENLQLKPPQPTSSRHRIPIRIHIRRGGSFSQSLQSATTLVVADPRVGIVAVVGGVSHDLIRGYFRREEREGDEPEDDGEDVEAEDRPVIVDDWRSSLGDDDVDGYYEGCDCL
jgi:hypothetical protein